MAGGSPAGTKGILSPCARAFTFIATLPSAKALGYDQHPLPGFPAFRLECFKHSS